MGGTETPPLHHSLRLGGPAGGGAASRRSSAHRGKKMVQEAGEEVSGNERCYCCFCCSRGSVSQNRLKSRFHHHCVRRHIKKTNKQTEKEYHSDRTINDSSASSGAPICCTHRGMIKKQSPLMAPWMHACAWLQQSIHHYCVPPLTLF